MKSRVLLCSALMLLLTGLAGWRLTQSERQGDVPYPLRVLAKKTRVVSPQTPAPDVKPLPPASAPSNCGPGKHRGPLARLVQEVDMSRLTPAQLEAYPTKSMLQLIGAIVASAKFGRPVLT